MSYATLSDRNGYSHSNIYENIHDDNMYDAPYEETGRRHSGNYEPEPGDRLAGSGITINGVAVR